MYTLKVIGFILLSVLVTGMILHTRSKQHKCSRCGSRACKDGYYSRGWNHLCSQAHGSRGHFCMDCCQIDFEASDEEYLEKLPKWCDHAKRPIDPEYAESLKD